MKNALPMERRVEILIFSLYAWGGGLA
jgi:hypothetical protein